ncbi:type IV secretory system conjugative DNA transfer family protein [Butyrivibrio sp. JL13D10]|uniref:type IV secretory system conjugative DNA transfer family protein n=1 Tax=Butyrivibrio sp. JL13D10 TaxID=3236815 RepID=UPI0038B5785D
MYLIDILYVLAVIALVAIIGIRNIDFRRNKLDTKPKKFVEKSTRKVKKGTAEGVTFGSSKKNPLSAPMITESAFGDEGHILAVGGTGLGKSTALLIPTLINWCKSWRNHRHKRYFITWDISGDLHTAIGSLTGNTIVFKMGNPDSIGYNPFAVIDAENDRNLKIKHLVHLALTLMPKHKDSSEAGDYYRKEGLKILKAAFIAFYFEGYDFVEICEKVHDLDWHQLLNEIDRTGNDDAIRLINGFADPNLPLSYTSSAKQNCEDAVALFATDENIKAIIHRGEPGNPSWCPSDMERNNIFIVIDDGDLEEYEQLNCLIANQCLQFIQNRPLSSKTSILFCMDEAASLGNIDILPALRKFRKRHCRIFILTQSLIDLDLTWGEKQRIAMMTNFKYKVILESSEPTEQEYWSKLAGKHWQWVKNGRTKNSSGEITYSETLSLVNKIEPYTLSNLGNNLVLISPDGVQMLEKDFYFN